jgi:hypothetical protein
MAREIGLNFNFNDNGCFETEFGDPELSDESFFLHWAFLSTRLKLSNQPFQNSLKMMIPSSNSPIACGSHFSAVDHEEPWMADMKW